MSNLMVFTDGGCLGRNPSPHGGTWAFCAVRDDRQVLAERSGLVQPLRQPSGDPTPVSNNVAELYAAWQALCWLGPEVPCVLWTDSRLTQLRLTRSHRFAGVPPSLHREILRLRARLRFTVILGAGHPTKQELAQGFRARNGLPTSRWNVRVDALCQQRARKFFAKE